MTVLDWVIVGFVILLALRGLRTGFAASVLSLVGLLLGALIGYRVAPWIVERFDLVRFAPLVVLGCVIILALVLQELGVTLGSVFREGVGRVPLVGRALEALDGVGGVLFGAALGVLIAWMASLFLLHAPLPQPLKAPIQQSQIISTLNRRVPSNVLITIFTRLDPIPQITGPIPQVGEPNSEVLNRPGVRQAAPSVVRIVGLGQGYGVEGSGWVAAPGLVVTNAHVVEGSRNLRVQPYNSSGYLQASVVLTDQHNDVAVLRVSGLQRPALRISDPSPGESVAVLGFPENGPFRAVPGRIGGTGPVVFSDTSGGDSVRRTVTSVRAVVQPGNSGGPVVNSDGEVVATIFAGRVGMGDVGYAIPSSIVRQDLARARQRAAATTTEATHGPTISAAQAQSVSWGFVGATRRAIGSDKTLQLA